MFDCFEEDRNLVLDNELLNGIVDRLPKTDDIKCILPLIWSEHCLECSAPECYNSCNMYESNRYGRCKRTAYGVKCYKDNRLLYPAFQLKYRKWGKLRCAVNQQLIFEPGVFSENYEKYTKRRNFLLKVGKPLNFLPKKYKDIPARSLHHSYIKKFSSQGTNENVYSEELCFIFFSLQNEKFTFMLDAYDNKKLAIVKKTFEVKPGLNIWRINGSELFGANKKNQLTAFELYPYDNYPAEVIFFLSDFVTFNPEGKFKQIVQAADDKAQPAAKAKCVVWDLDNTIWDGIIGDDGIEGIQLKPNIAAVIRQLDEKGVLQSVCSKNDFELAWKALCKFGLNEYFLYPQINWNSKSSNIEAIAKQLNINANTFVFIDDSSIERQEVLSILPFVRVYDEKITDKLLTLPEFDLPVTEDSQKRRSYYMSEIRRNQVFREEPSTSYRDFIKQCKLEAEISRCSTEEDKNRCFELIQRTNQLNASSRRIAFDEFCNILDDREKIVLKVFCKDKYGAYGIVGCMIFDLSHHNLLCTDFVFSCRVAKKKVESAIISFLMKYYSKEIAVIYFPTQRNNVLLDEFLQFGGEYKENEHIVSFTLKNIKDDDWVLAKFIDE